MGSPTQTSNTLLSSHAGAHKLPPESDDGPIEYKLKLIDPPPERLQHLVTQMKYRLSEGDGEAYYEIGVADNGTLVGLSDKDMEATLNSLRKMTSALHAEMSVVLERVIPAKSGSPRRVAEILIRRGASWSHDFMDVRVAMLGSHDAGKSSLLGILTHGELDNGRGKSRLNLLRHLHEIQSGRTSSISQQVIGFAEDGEIINYGSTNISSLEEICEVASKIVTFLDTCGHPKYQHTTIGGLTGQHPDYACLMVAANSGGISEITKEHLGIAVVLKLPVFVVMSKIDLATPEQLTSTIASLLSLLKSPAILRTPLIIQGESDVIESNIGFVSSRVVPIFLVSNVTGENLDLLTKFASQLPKPDAGSDQSKDEEVEFQVDETYSVPDVGCVVGGTLLSGLIDLSTLERYKYFLGPDRGHFIPVQITSVHRQRIPVQTLRPGQAASLALAFPATWSASESPLDASLTKGGFRTTEPPRNFKLRRGQVIIGPFVIASDNGPSGFAFSMDSPPLPATHAGLLLHVDDGMSLPLLSSSPATPDNFYRSGPNRRSYTPVLGNPGPLLFVGGTSPGGSAGASSASSDDDSEYPSPFSRTVWEFEADIHVLYHTGVLASGCEGTAFCGSVRQAVRIISVEKNGPDGVVAEKRRQSRGALSTLSASVSSAASSIVTALDEDNHNGRPSSAPDRPDSPLRGVPITKASRRSNGSRNGTYGASAGSTDGLEGLRTGEQGRCRFRWVQEPEHVRAGYTILFRSGKTKCIGRITFAGRE